MDKSKAREFGRILPVSRRRFVQGLTIGGAITALDWKVWPAFAGSRAQMPVTLTGTHFELAIDSLPVNFTGRRAVATAVNGSVPGPTLRWREGDTVTLAVTNRLKVPSSIHWHAIRLPADMDGVPGLSFPGIAPGETFVYSFPVVQNGTYWYHSHSRFQEQTGLLGALVIDPRDKHPSQFDREYIVMLTDWTDTDPERIFSNLKEQGEYYNFHQRTAGAFFSDIKKKGLAPALSNRLVWGRRNMTPADISDVSGATYTYLLNGNAPNMNWTGLFKPGERVRLRFINGSSMTLFDIRIPGLPMTIVAADGNELEPVMVDEFRMGTAEVYDVIVQPQENAAYTIFAQSEDRTGFARGTLAPRKGMTGAIPPMDPRPIRTMVDMGMGSMAGMDMSGGTKAATAPMQSTTSDVGKSTAGMKVGNTAGTLPFPQPGPNTMPLVVTPLIVPPLIVPPRTGSSEAMLHPSNPLDMRVGPQVDMVSKHVTGRLNDPGDGLIDNGRRVLTYADLRARYRGVDGRPPTREVELHLSGNMGRYIWGFNGEKFSSAKPIVLKLGDRVRFVLINDTMMEHPIHLHGMWSELENGQGEFNPYKHTIIVKPSERVSYLVSADTPGRWAYHCHLLYHMEAGMFRTVVVS